MIAGAVNVPALQKATATGEDRRVALQPEYLLAALDNLTSEKVSINITPGMRPTVITAAGDRMDDVDAYRHLLMPVHLKE